MPSAAIEIQELQRKVSVEKQMIILANLDIDDVESSDYKTEESSEYLP